jgi:hypothetical protein
VEELTRSKPSAVLALLMLSLAATALVQEEGGEKGAEDGGYMGGWPEEFEHICSTL